MPLRLLTVLAALTLGGCLSKAPRVRIATASAEEITKAREKREVWYHFQKGDVVPFVPMFYGAGMGAPSSPVGVEAQRDFYIVFRKNQPVMLSLDGKRRIGSGSTILVVTPVEGGTGGMVSWMTFLGRSIDAEKELESLLRRAD